MVTFLLMSAAPAAASCEVPGPVDQAIAKAQTVFVGTVIGLDFGGRVATFDVAEIWRGTTGSTVVVNGGPSMAELESARRQGTDVATSVDRSYELGTTYLVVSHGREAGMLADNACSATQPFSRALEELRPESIIVPQAPTASEHSAPMPSWVWVGAGVAVAGIGTATTVAVRRHHAPA